ncbi:hypothetical protein CDAR_7121 [Caerostris darwini]|uniref:Uncharacterized protein n=1 Tax=Caerostris darwini TaxID=1538125 RepID=A0AAV4N5C3_9ARAC|nr:hypothetical protein CDAR_7121 [Caerostris darwini]
MRLRCDIARRDAKTTVLRELDRELDATPSSTRRPVQHRGRSDSFRTNAHPREAPVFESSSPTVKKSGPAAYSRCLHFRKSTIIDLYLENEVQIDTHRFSRCWKCKNRFADPTSTWHPQMLALVVADEMPPCRTSPAQSAYSRPGQHSVEQTSILPATEP